MPSLWHISGSEPADPEETRRVVETAHSLNIKVLFYCVPQLISIHAPYHQEYTECRTENLKVWHSLSETQIVFYEKEDRYDADELYLRCKKAYEFIYSSVVACVESYGFDGLYVDYAWPAAGLCSDPSHNHASGLFNFYDYWKLLRDRRSVLGDKKLMIGHGGGLLTASDFVEAFDACLTGEAQKELEPATIGRHFGTAPTLWGMHRRKQSEFRSAETIPRLVREAITPHVGLGVLGRSVIANLDPAVHEELLPLWQMWRAFPVERACVYTYLTPGMVTVDNEEITYSLWVTPDPYFLLILANAGGPFHDSYPSVGAEVHMSSSIVDHSVSMRTWRLKGNRYETFRIEEVARVSGGRILVPEIMKNEIIGFILSPGDPPGQLFELQQHLEGRWDRLPGIYESRMSRLRNLDAQLDGFSRLPDAARKETYDDFMRDRLTE